ncbi:MAG: ATP-dependent DNA helicase, partial [Polyangiaceae bacterium]
AAQRLCDAIGSGAASQQGGEGSAPTAQTLHRLLGWSPSRARFARGLRDPLPHRVVVVDEASMIDLAMMDRLFGAVRDDARLVLLGDADQLPSIDAGAVFRDLCDGLGAARLTKNLRVADGAGAAQIVVTARAVNAGSLGADFAAATRTRARVDDVTFKGVEHLNARWSDVAEAFLERWWRARIAPDESFARRAERALRLRGGVFVDDADRAQIRALFDVYARSRILCVTRAGGLSTSTEAISDHLMARLRRDSRRAVRSAEFAPGCPVLVQRNDYERGLYNGDQGIVVRADCGDAGHPSTMAVFPNAQTSEPIALTELRGLAPAFALTVHKAQGSEFDHVALVLPEIDLPILTRELVYTAITRARRSVLIVGGAEVLSRAISRVILRESGVASKLRGG